MQKTLIYRVALSVVFSVLTGVGFSEENPDSLEQYYDLIYQIKVIEQETGSKTAIGSGFQITEDGLVVTNYHVISDYVTTPDRYHIEFLDQNQEEGGLELVTFDVINDLALLRRANPPADFLPLAVAEMSKGDTIYALGNPKDVGITLVFGAFNGLAELNYNPNIVFSGSLNPGMSGGPSLNTSGEVIGVNVATAGSQLSFLIPAIKILPMLERANDPLPTEEFQTETVRQISTFQNERIGGLIESDWPMTPLGRGMAIREIRSDMRCWGRSNEREEEDLYSIIMLGCNSADNIYLSSRLDTGQVHYSFAFKSSDDLGVYRFHRYLSDNALSGDNRASQSEVSEYRCQEDYIKAGEYGISDTQNLAVLCVRNYQKLDGLYDILFFATVTEGRESLTAHFTLAGVTQEIGHEFTEKFMRHIRWN